MPKLHSLMLTMDDWANTGFRFNKCLRMLGLEALMFKGALHPFLYPEQAMIHPNFKGLSEAGIPNLDEIAREADVLHFVASTLVDTGVLLRDKKVVMQHGGSIYRQKHEEINDQYNKFVDATIIQCPDLLGLGANNETLIYYPVDTDWIQPVYEPKADVPIIGHFPSNPEVKGTKLIVEAMDELEKSGLKFHFVCETNRISWTENLKRMADCDIIIETCAPEQNGKKYGEWGNTALEAAALGKVVITNTLSEDVYRKEYGELPLLIANDKDAIKEHIGYLLRLPDVLNQHKHVTRGWVETHHSMQATAKRLWERVYSKLLPGVEVCI